jgi:hypothetical protein
LFTSTPNLSKSIVIYWRKTKANPKQNPKNETKIKTKSKTKIKTKTKPTSIVMQPLNPSISILGYGFSRYAVVVITTDTKHKNNNKTNKIKQTKLNLYQHCYATT